MVNDLRMHLLFTLTFCFLGIMLCATSATADEKVTEAERLFALKVQPLFKERCLACHGEDPDKVESEFDMRSRESVLEGGEGFGGEVLVPGNSGESRLYDLVRRTFDDLAMPPKESEKLTDEELEWVKEWIDGGAPWPDEKRVAAIYKALASGATVKTSGGLSDDWTNRKYKEKDLWAYRPLWQDDDNLLEDGSSPVDQLVDLRLKELNLAPAPRADRRTLIRRATYDLLGLPPTVDEIRTFLADERSDEEAFAALVDRLLKSPHYGEQWGRHWLDVVRYADSSGFANDWERPNAWRYRDYVVRAFNQDKPYNQFVSEQIAGDEVDPKNPENLIAVGFLRMGPWEQTGMSVAKVTRQQFLDDVTDSVGQVFLAHALQCCRCHDHKFDPIPTRDYYSIQAVFGTTQFAEVDAEWLPEENRNNFKTDEAYLKRRLQANQELKAAINKRRAANQLKWFKKKGLPYKTRAEAVKAGLKDLPPLKAFNTPDDFGQERIARKWETRFKWEQDRYKPIAFSVYSGPGRPTRNQFRNHKPGKIGRKKPEATRILKGGSVFSPTEAVKPGVISAVPDGLKVTITEQTRGRRRDFAKWITDPENPLSSRVMVNRIWQFHFGKPLAGNPNNFGATGKKPTHPRLLDWLAAEFIRSGWSVKHMHRVIMSTKTYTRSSRAKNAKELAEKDPGKNAYATFSPRRLTAEEIRDAQLAVSGELNRELGGVPNRPDMNLEAALQPRMIMGTFAPSYTPNPKPEQRNRRSLYAIRLRGLRDPFMETFNQPGSEKSCEIRDRSTVTPQALMMLNGEEVADRALALAADVLKSAKSDSAAVAEIYRRAYGREPTLTESNAAIAHWQTVKKIQSKLKFDSAKRPTKIVRRANEENTGEIFSFTERLFEHEDYVPDLRPEDVNARTRALADVCHAILNSNEFVFVY